MKTITDIGADVVWCDLHFFAEWRDKEVGNREANGWTTQVATCNGRSE